MQSVDGQKMTHAAPSLRILIVDSHPDSADVLGLLLEKVTKYAVFIARDGHDAVQKAIEVHPDVILLEVRIPRLDGYGVIDKLRQLKCQAQLIFLTGYQTPTHLDRCQQLGIPHLLKPVPLETLLALLDDVARRHPPAA